MSRVEEDLPTYPEHLSSPSLFSAVRVTWSLVFCEMLCRWLFVFLLLTIVSVRRITTYYYFFGIFKLEKRVNICNVYPINLIALSKTSTQILTKATSNIVGL
jgi:hypothetical protein